MTNNKSIKNFQKKPSLWQWTPVIGMGKVIFDYHKGKQSILNFHNHKKGMKRHLVKAHALYQGAAIFFTYLLLRNLFSI